MPDQNSLTSGFHRMHDSAAANLDKKAGTFIRLNKAVGPYGTILFFVGFVGCLFFGTLGVWIKYDIANPIVKGHLEYLKSETDKSQRMIDTQGAMKDALEAIVEQSKELNSKTEKTHEMQATTQALLQQQTEWHRRSTEEQRKTNQLLQTGRIKVSNGPETADGKSPMPMDGQPN